MPNVELVATKDFSYSTRRLKAGDSFSVPQRDARILIAIKKAEAAREPGHVEPPPQRVVERATEVTPVRAALDHDHDGKPGGSPKGRASTSSRGAARRRARKSAAQKA